MFGVFLRQSNFEKRQALMICDPLSHTQKKGDTVSCWDDHEITVEYITYGYGSFYLFIVFNGFLNIVFNGFFNCTAGHLFYYNTFFTTYSYL